jgi:hypothetical protein
MRHPPMLEPEAVSAASLFALIWDTLCDVMGSAATATVVRRSQRVALLGHAATAAIGVSRTGLDYAYRVPESWNVPGEVALDELRAFLTALVILLRELTGTIVIRRLKAVPQFRDMHLELEGE